MKDLASIRRPAAFLAISLACLGLHHALLRAVVHGYVGHALLGAGNATPPTSAAVLAVSLLVIRFATMVVVPGLLLAAAAEILAYLLVGPRRTSAEDATAETDAETGADEC